MSKATGRFHTEDVVPEGVATDVEFQRAVQQLEELQQGRAGWLDNRGAFDRGDQAYIRAEEEKRRHAEETMQERERAEYLAARVMAANEDSKARAAPAGPCKKTGSAAAIAGKDDGPAKKKRVFPAVKVKSTPAVGPAVKRAKSDEDAQNAAAAQPKEEDGAKILSGSEEEGGLAALLGGYGSASDESGREEKEGGEEKETASDDAVTKAAHEKSSKPKLPSAADLLGS